MRNMMSKNHTAHPHPTMLFSPKTRNEWKELHDVAD